MRKRVKPGVVRKITLDIEIDEELQQVLAGSRDTLSAWVQAAIVRRLADWEGPLEFVHARRTRRDVREAGKRRSVGVQDSSVLNTKLDRPDGVPLACADMNNVRDWAETWRLSPNCRAYIDEMRTSLSRPVLTNTEWSAIVRYMGSEPGSGKRKTVTELTTDD